MDNFDAICMNHVATFFFLYPKVVAKAVQKQVTSDIEVRRYGRMYLRDITDDASDRS